MKKILCFGDSNVYGFNPSNGQRFSEKARWTGILKTLCKDKFEVIEAGCNNRTGFKDNPTGFEQTGYKVLPTILSNNLNFVILAIGINDLQYSYNTSLDEVKQGLKNLIEITKTCAPNAKIIIVSPTAISNDIKKSFFRTLFNTDSIEKSRSLATIYFECAQDYNCDFIDLNTIAKVSSFDGLHYTEDEHKKIAFAIFEKIKNF